MSVSSDIIRVRKKEVLEDENDIPTQEEVS